MTNISCDLNWTKKVPNLEEGTCLFTEKLVASSQRMFVLWGPLWNFGDARLDLSWLWGYTLALSPISKFSNKSNPSGKCQVQLEGDPTVLQNNSRFLFSSFEEYLNLRHWHLMQLLFSDVTPWPPRRAQPIICLKSSNKSTRNKKKEETSRILFEEIICVSEDLVTFKVSLTGRESWKVWNGKMIGQRSTWSEQKNTKTWLVRGGVTHHSETGLPKNNHKWYS